MISWITVCKLQSNIYSLKTLLTEKNLPISFKTMRENESGLGEIAIHICNYIELQRNGFNIDPLPHNAAF